MTTDLRERLDRLAAQATDHVFLTPPHSVAPSLAGHRRTRFLLGLATGVTMMAAAFFIGSDTTPVHVTAGSDTDDMAFVLPDLDGHRALRVDHPGRYALDASLPLVESSPTLAISATLACHIDWSFAGFHSAPVQGRFAAVSATIVVHRVDRPVVAGFNIELGGPQVHSLHGDPIGFGPDGIALPPARCP